MRRPKCSASKRDVALAHAQRRQRDDLEAQPVEQIGAEAALVDQARQMLVGGGDDADVDLDRLGRADAGDLAIFDRAQQPVLRRRRQRRQFVEEQGPAVGFLEAAVAGLGGAGEAARFMPEQFGLDQVFGKRGAVHRHQRPRPASRQMVEPLGDQFLARAALADYQHRTVERRGTAGALDRVEESEARADELIASLHANMWWQIPPSGKLSVAAVGRKMALFARFQG